MSKHFTRQQYRDLLQELIDMGYPVMPVRDRIPAAVVLRHDVDDDLEASVDMARLEADYGIRSTYYILNTAPYYPEKLGMINMIEELGHEIGWHNNAIADHLRRGVPLMEAITEPLAMLRAHGFDIAGTASHGDSLCYNSDGSLRFVNYEVWTDAPKTSDWAACSLESQGLEYEAYWIGHTHYISESGGVFRCDVAKRLDEFDRDKNPDKLLQILVHPQWWQL